MARWWVSDGGRRLRAAGEGLTSWSKQSPDYMLAHRRHLCSAVSASSARRAGLSFGQLLAPNLMLLFMPVPHTSLFPWLTGLSRNQLIRYHRCVRPSWVESWVELHRKHAE